MNPIILLVIGAVGLAGCIVLLLLGMNMLREERAAKDGRTPGATAGTPAEANAAAPDPAKTASGTGPLAGVTARLSGGGARGSAHEVLRVLRDNLTGRLLLEIAGKRYASLDEVGEGEMRQALLTTLHDLETFAGGAPAALIAPTQPTPELAGAASVPAVTTRAARPAAEKATDEYRPLPPPTMNPFKQMAVLREMAKNPPPPPKSITEQIDEVLQARISGTPMIHRGLHVKPGPRGDAVFEADGQSYLSVDELPDVEVRDVIRAAVAEWEAKR